MMDLAQAFASSSKSQLSVMGAMGQTLENTALLRRMGQVLVSRV